MFFDINITWTYLTNSGLLFIMVAEFYTTDTPQYSAMAPEEVLRFNNVCVVLAFIRTECNYKINYTLITALRHTTTDFYH